MSNEATATTPPCALAQRCADLAAMLADARARKDVRAEHLAIARLISVGGEVLAERATQSASKEPK